MHRATWTGLLAAMAAVWISGCSCGGEPPVESQLAVAFESPTDGQRLALDEDADPGTDGFQQDVVAVGRDTAGREVTLASAKLEVRAGSEQTWTAGPAARIEGAKVRFASVTLPLRTSVLRVTVEESGSRRTATQTVSVAVGTEVPSVDLTSPAEGQVLREVDDADPATPGYQVRFGLKGTALRGASGLLSCAGVCGLAPVPFTLGQDGSATVVATLTEPVREAQLARCTAVLKRATGDVTSAPRGFTLDTEAPRLVVASPVAPVASPTFDVVAVVRSVEDGSTAVLSREGADAVQTQVRAGAVTFTAVTVPGDGTFDFRLRLTDSGGNVTEQPLQVVVASAVPVLTLDVPAVVTSDANGDAADGVQAPASVKVNGLPVGTDVELWTTVTSRLGQPLRVATVASGADRVAAFQLDLAEGANTVKACVRNSAGLQTCSQPTTVSVQMGRSTCRIVEPAAREFVTGNSVAVRVDAPNGAVTLAQVAPDGTATSVSATASGGAATLTAPLTQDGAWSLVASCAGGGRSQRIVSRRDTAKPALTATVRDAVDGRIGADFVDTSVLPGMQVVLDVTTDADAQVFVDGCGLTGTASAVANGAGVATLRGISIPATGTCTLTVRAVDPAGNSATQTVAVASAFAQSSLSFSAPDPNRTLGPADGTAVTGGLSVPMTLAFGEGVSGVLKLYRDTTEVGSMDVASAEVKKTFTAVTLREGVNVLRAVLTNTAGAGACASALYTLDTTPEAIALTAPGASTQYSLNEDQDPATPGIQRPLSFTLNGASSSAVVDVCTDIALTVDRTPCRDGSGWFTLASSLPPDTTRFSYPDGQYSLKVVLDDAGRTAESAPVTLRVDGSRPEVTALEFVGDANGDRILNLAESPSGAPVVRVSTTGLEHGRPVQVRDARSLALLGQAASTGSRTDVTLTALASLSEADASLVVVLTDTVGNVNRTVPANPPNPLDPLNAAALTDFRVDRVPPTVNVSAPAVGATLGPAQDADPTASGYQLRVSMLTSADVGADGVLFTLEPGLTPVSLTPSGRAVTHDFTVPASGTQTYTLTVTARDTAGNPSAAVTRTVTVDLEAPVLSLESPTPGQQSDSALVPVRVAVQGGDGLTARVYSTPEGSGTRVQVGALTVSQGVALGTLNFPDGRQDVTVEVDDPAGNRGAASAAGVDVHLVGCDVALTSPADAVRDFIQADDEAPGTPGLQFTVRGHTTRCAGRTVSLLKGTPAVAVGTTLANASSGDFAFPVTLADGEQGRLSVEMVDANNNHTSDFVDYTVDITPPTISTVSPPATQLTFVAASNAHLFPTPEAGYVKDVSPGGDAEADFDVTVAGAVGGAFQFFYRGQPVSTSASVAQDGQPQTVRLVLPHDTSGSLELRVRDRAGNTAVRTVTAVVDVVPPAQVSVTRTLVSGAERKAQVDVAWTASGDDGVSGMPAGYDLRWTTETQLPGGIPNETTWYSNKVRQETGGLLPASDTSRRLTLPPLATYFIEVRARDEVGNLSEPRTIPALVNSHATTLTNPTATLGIFGSALASGDLNGDGRDDLVAGNFRNASSGTADMGGVYIYYDATNASAAPQVLLPPTSEAQQYFGTEVAVGNVGDATNERRPDVLVGSPRWSAFRGRAFLYFGRANQPVDPTPVEFRGHAGVGATNLGWAVRILPDLNGDGLGEVLLSADGENGGRGRMFLFFGRSRADWLAVATGHEADNVPFIPMDSADRIIEGTEAPITPATSTLFGRRRGQASVGDLDGDGHPELSLSVPNDKFNLVYIFRGSLLLSRSGPNVADRTLLATEALQTLTLGAPGGGGPNGFGVDVVGASNFGGTAAVDLVVSQPSVNRVNFYLDGTTAGFSAQPAYSLQVADDASVSGARFFGYVLASADLNGDSLPDLVVSEAATAGSSVWVLYHGASGPMPFDAVAGDGFAQARFKGIKSLGSGLALGDFNGDGAVDVAAGDPFDTPGKITVWY
ncbi:FG-GAP repeat protein [Corallococcus sp. M34]|uniref:integrin alpha n=1 Tax=Citreicoccus inhibens TaxID=2849499 RepID=UPI001C24E038|nr:integrin alpha [Citreicoccus inhibens]MBU8896139.1 FG-GAP repeat protein [Citreicoccus inhibens]